MVFTILLLNFETKHVLKKYNNEKEKNVFACVTLVQLITHIKTHKLHGSESLYISKYKKKRLSKEEFD